MTLEYKIGDVVVFKHSVRDHSKEYIGEIVDIEHHSMNVFGEEVVISIVYTIDSDSLNVLVETNRYWTILRKVEEPTLEERISTIEERLGVLDKHVKKYIVDKVEEIDTVGGFEYLKDNYGNGYLLLENRDLVKIYDVVE